MNLNFGKWLPDLPFYLNPGLVEAKNVMPVDGSYKDFLALATSGDALAARPQGAYAATSTDGSPEIYAGDTTTLQQRVGTSWTDRSGATYTTASIAYWRFAQFNNSIIATNYSDAIQSKEVGAGVDFADLSAGAPKARQIGIINNFVVVGDTDDATNGAVPYRTQWCAIGDETDWPVMGTADARSKQSSEQFLNAAFGAVTAIASGVFYGIVFQQRGINRFTYVGGDTVFQVQDIDTSRGCWAPQSMVQVGKLIYFLAADGFYVTDGLTVVPIGEGVDKAFFLDFDQTYRERMTSAVDAINKVILWSYPSFSATAGVPDRLIMYNYAEKRFARAEETVQMIFSSLSQGYTLEDLDSLFTSIDDMTVSLDSSLWTGGIPNVMGFGSNELGSFSGASKDARFETGEVELDDALVWVDGIRPMVTGYPITIQASIALRENQDNEARAFGTAVDRTTRSGVCDFREQGRFASARLDITGGFDRAIGIKYAISAGDGL